MTHNLKKTNRLKTITPSSSLLPLSYQDSLFPISLQPLLKQGKASRRYLEKSSPKCLLDSQQGKRKQSASKLSRRMGSSVLKKGEQSRSKIISHPASCLDVASRCWCLYDATARRYLGFREGYKREIASLTKIMTAIVAIETIQHLRIPTDCKVCVTPTAANLIGTSAGLKGGYWATLADLLYGTMLPSGNDAAYSLAEYIGYFLCLHSEKGITEKEIVDLSEESTGTYVGEFIRVMNEKAYKLQLRETRFSNPHGLQNAFNISTPKDILRLSLHSAKNKLFRQVVNAKHYLYIGENSKGERVAREWRNTNKLLEAGWEGIKTGQTPTAGSCLSSLRDKIYIVVLNCPNSEARFTDTQKLYNWYRRQYYPEPCPAESVGEEKAVRLESCPTLDSI